MAGKLDKMIAPDERVVYRTRRRMRNILANLFLIPTWVILVTQPLLWRSEVGTIWDYIVVMLVTILCFVAVVTWNICTKTLVVTNRRFLCKTGTIKRKIHDIALSEVERVHCNRINYLVRHGIIRILAREITSLYYVPDAEDVCRAIRTELGLQQPPVLSRKLIVWGWLAFLFIVALSISFGNEAGWGFIGMSDWARTYMPLPQVLVFCLMVPFILGGVSAGYIVGPVLALTILRIFLSADEVKQLICLGYKPLAGDNWRSRLDRCFLRLGERYVSWLYGQPIRCEDDE